MRPTGFRIDERTRFELEAARLYTGRGTLQSVLELAVEKLLAELREREGFQDALRTAEEARRQEAGVTDIRDRRTDGSAS
jgi:hypothetical protein